MEESFHSYEGSVYIADSCLFYRLCLSCSLDGFKAVRVIPRAGEDAPLLTAHARAAYYKTSKVTIYFTICWGSNTP